MTKNFIPSKSQRKENKLKKKLLVTKHSATASNKFEISTSKLVDIKALDFTFGGAIGSALGFKPKRAVLISRAFITTSLPLPRDVWFKVVTLLEYELKKYEEAHKNGKV